MVKSGGFDCFEGIHRAQYLFNDDPTNSTTFIEKLIRYCSKQNDNKNSAQTSLFGDTMEQEDVGISFPECEEISKLEMLKQEKEMIGFYLSGHPLDIYKYEAQCFTNTSAQELDNIDKLFKDGRTDVTICGIVSSAEEKISPKDGNKNGSFIVEDADGSHKFNLYGKDFLNFESFLSNGIYVAIRGIIQENVWKNKETGEETRRIRYYISKMELMQDLFEKYGKSITIVVNSEKIDKEFVKTISKAASNCKGNVPIRMIIRDDELDMSVTLNASKHKVDMRSFIPTIEELQKKGIIEDFIPEVNPL